MDLSTRPRERRLVSLRDMEDNPYQTRTMYGEAGLVALADNIHQVGLLQVPVGRQAGERYQIAFGHRRRRAFERLFRSGLLQYECIPLDVMELTDQEMFELAVSENLKREDLSPIEKAEALKQYMDQFHATSVQAAKVFDIKETTVRSHIRLLNLPKEAQQQVHAGKLSQSRARKLLEKPETELKRIERAEEHFDLREQLILLLYGQMRHDTDDQRLFKKIKDLVEENQQLQRQVEMMNGRKLERSRGHSTPQTLQRAAIVHR